MMEMIDRIEAVLAFLSHSFTHLFSLLLAVYTNKLDRSEQIYGGNGNGSGSGRTNGSIESSVSR